MLKEFKKFAMRGNVMDMAIGIILGSAFGKIVSSFVADVLMPPIGILVGNVNFADFALTLKEKTADSSAVVIKYGAFINTIIDFTIIAFAIFIVVKQINRFSQKKKAEVTTKDCPRCLSSIPLAATRCPNCTSEITT